MDNNQTMPSSDTVTTLLLPLLPAIAILLMGKAAGVDLGVGAWFSTLL